MQRRRLAAGLVLPLWAGLGGAAASASGQPLAAGRPRANAIEISDSIELPPLRREFRSPGGQFLLVVESADGWKSLHPTAQLLDTGRAPARLLWARQLEQQFGPRTAAVSPQGQVLLVDEWINVTSRWALQLLDPNNRVVATYDHDGVVAALGVTAESVVRHARSGTWLTSGPSLSPDGRSAVLAAGGRQLRVSFIDGKLSSTS